MRRLYHISLYYDCNVITGANKRFEVVSKYLASHEEVELILVVSKGNKPIFASELGIRVVEISGGRLSKYFTLSKMLYDIEPSVIISDFMPIPPFFVCSKHRYFQLVHDIRNSTNFNRASFSKLASWFQGFQWKNVGNLVTVSEFTKNRLVDRYKIPANNIVVSYNGIEKSEVEFSNDSIKRDIDLLYIATFEKRKNHKVLIRALANANQIKRVCLIGRDLGYRDIVALEIEKLRQVRDDLEVEVIESVGDDKALQSYYRRSKLFVSPSLYEGFGMPIVEAMLNGCKVLCSDIPVFREVAEKYSDYFNPRDCETISRILDQAIRELESFKSGPQQEFCLDKYDWESISKRLVVDMLKKRE